MTKGEGALTKGEGPGTEIKRVITGGKMDRMIKGSSHKSGRKENQWGQRANNGNKIIKTNKTMIFTQKYLFFLYKEKKKIKKYNK